MSLSFRKAIYVKKRLQAWLTGRSNTHLIHIRKTGGTALKHVLTQHPITQGWVIHLHPHRIKLEHIPRGHRIMFVTRDPVSRFVSGFGSRLRKGAPAHHVPWSAGEELAFSRFPDPDSLAVALDPSHPDHVVAEHAMRNISHLNSSYWDWLGDEATLNARMGSILFIGRIESFEEDFAVLRDVLGLPEGTMLPADPKAAHRARPAGNASARLEPEAIRWLKSWYAADFEFLAWCENWRRKQGGPVLAEKARRR